MMRSLELKPLLWVLDIFMMLGLTACSDDDDDTAPITGPTYPAGSLVSMKTTCAVCHDSNLLWNFHLQFAPNDQFGMDCDSCHDVVGTEQDSWDGIKARYREVLFGN